ncbi:hypothetical protein VTH06DRAFT_1799 [Thermothelomyces fergusii]
MTKEEYRQCKRSDFDRYERWDHHEYYCWLREDNGRGGFSEYVAEAKRRLAKHGFTRDFQFDKDPALQDRSTTWIEYLHYEYAWYDRYERSVKRLQPGYDEAWKKLVESGVLRPGETDANLRGMENAIRHQAEEDRAQEAVESAVAAARAALSESEKAKVGLSRVPPEERKRRLKGAYSRFVAAKAAHKAVKTRNNLITDFIRGTFDYARAKRNLRIQRARVQWALEQWHQIETELDGSSGLSCDHGEESSRPREDNDGQAIGQRPVAEKTVKAEARNIIGQTVLQLLTNRHRALSSFVEGLVLPLAKRPFILLFSIYRLLMSLRDDVGSNEGVIFIYYFEIARA